MTNSNNAAIREALIKVSEWMAHRIATGGFEASPTFPTVLEDVVLPALAKPPRNCDRFANELDAQLAFLNEVWLISIDRETMTEQDTYERWTDEMRTRYGKWLLATANEKGATDEGY